MIMQVAIQPVVNYTSEDREIFRRWTGRELNIYWSGDMRDSARMFALVDQSHEEKRSPPTPA